MFYSNLTNSQIFRITSYFRGAISGHIKLIFFIWYSLLFFFKILWFLQIFYNECFWLNFDIYEWYKTAEKGMNMFFGSNCNLISLYSQMTWYTMKFNFKAIDCEFLIFFGTKVKVEERMLNWYYLEHYESLYKLWKIYAGERR